MNEQAVSLAAIALAATSVGGVIWVVKYFAHTLAADLEAHTKAALQQGAAAKQLSKDSQKSTQASQEVLTFMRNLNGRLATITSQTITEQHVTEQVVEHQEVKEEDK